MSRHRFIPRPTLDEELRTRSLRYASAVERPSRRVFWPAALLAALFWLLVGAIAWLWSLA